jgi:hypothetical protein
MAFPVTPVACDAKLFMRNIRFNCEVQTESVMQSVRPSVSQSVTRGHERGGVSGCVWVNSGVYSEFCG